MENTITIKEKKLISAIQIALAQYDVYTEETESTLLHHVKALSIQNDQTTQLRGENERLNKLAKLLFSIIKENSMYIMAGQPDHEEQLKFVNSLNAIQKESEQLLKEQQ